MILQEAEEIHTEWMVKDTGRKWYEDPISGDYMKAADALRSIEERLENPDARNSNWFLTQMYARFWNDLADHASA